MMPLLERWIEAKCTPAFNEVRRNVALEVRYSGNPEHPGTPWAEVCDLQDYYAQRLTTAINLAAMPISDQRLEELCKFMGGPASNVDPVARAQAGAFAKDAELIAIVAILGVLEHLPGIVKERVVDYIARRVKVGP